MENDFPVQLWDHGIIIHITFVHYKLLLPVTGTASLLMVTDWVIIELYSD